MTTEREVGDFGPGRYYVASDEVHPGTTTQAAAITRGAGYHDSLRLERGAASALAELLTNATGVEWYFTPNAMAD